MNLIKMKNFSVVTNLKFFFIESVVAFWWAARLKVHSIALHCITMAVIGT
jgi:hypothetical protein